MADEKPALDEAAQAAGQAAAATTEAIQAVENNAEQAIANAQAEVAAAEKLSEKLTEAAMVTELGRRCAELENMVQQCQAKLQTVEANQANLIPLIAAMEATTVQLAELKSASLLHSQTQQPPKEKVVIVPEAGTGGVVDPTKGANEAPAAEAEPEQRKPRKRFV